jgi:FtsP/CotA-like multicopper oxidase with cupredoxin domain
MAKTAKHLGHALILAALALTLISPGAGAARRLGTVGGRVLAPNGDPVPGARVILQASEGRAPQATVTNRQGRFWFPMLPVGLYDVRASYRGRASEWRQNVNVRVGRQTTITLRLRAKKPAPVKAPPSLKQP